MMTPVPSLSSFRLLQLRLHWWWLKKQGWSMDGPRPKQGAITFFLLETDPKATFMMARLALWLGPQSTHVAHALHSHAHYLVTLDDRKAIEYTVNMAIEHDANIQLVHLDTTDKRIRIQSAFKPGSFSIRTVNYIERILAHSPQNQRIGPTSLRR
jgi:hypothetical protein